MSYMSSPQDWNLVWNECWVLPKDQREEIFARFSRMQKDQRHDHRYNHELLRMAMNGEDITHFEGAVEAYEEAMRGMELMDADI
jgi:hypothetical protein